MSNIDLLMGLDAGQLAKVPTKKLKIKRLSELVGADFVVTFKAVPAKYLTEIVSGTKGKDGSTDPAKSYEGNMKLVLAGLTDPSMKDAALQNKFKCSTPMQLLETIFSGGEISNIADEIVRLSGFGGDAVEEIKN